MYIYTHITRIISHAHTHTRALYNAHHKHIYTNVDICVHFLTMHWQHRVRYFAANGITRSSVTRLPCRSFSSDSRPAPRWRPSGLAPVRSSSLQRGCNGGYRSCNNSCKSPHGWAFCSGKNNGLPSFSAS